MLLLLLKTQGLLLGLLDTSEKKISCTTVIIYPDAHAHSLLHPDGPALQLGALRLLGRPGSLLLAAGEGHVAEPLAHAGGTVADQADTVHGEAQPGKVGAEGVLLQREQLEGTRSWK